MHIEQLHIDMEDERFILESSFTESLKKLLLNQTHLSGVTNLSKNTKFTDAILNELSLKKIKRNFCKRRRCNEKNRASE